MRALSYAVRPLSALKYLGQLLILLALLTLVPLTVSLAYSDFQVSLRYSIVVVAVLLLGFFLHRLPTPKRIQTNEAMVIGALVFLFTPMAMIWPAMASGLGFMDSLFENISAVTTTGLSIAGSLADKSPTFLFSRAWMQWIGGLGIVVLSLAVMIQPGLTAKRMGYTEDYEDDLAGGTRAHARRFAVTYVVLTGIGITLLGLAGTGWFNAVLYSLSAVSTGGFAPQDGGLETLAGWGQAAVILLSMAGAVPLALYARLPSDRWRALASDRQLEWLLATGIVAALVLSGFLWYSGSATWLQAFRHGALNAFSALSTAGFASLDISQIDAGSRLVLIFTMLLGGAAGSTAGGIKIFRLMILVRVVQFLVQRASMPRQAVAEASLGGRRLEPEEIRNALVVILLFLISIGISWLPFVAAGYDPFLSLFDVVSAITTSGLSAGVTSPDLAPFLKGVLSADMLLGRLEILAWLVLFYPRTWIGRRTEG